ncbi:MAG: non-canonical purine NTP pyrophosphatase, RdgB/HAM1 family [Acidobacteria bacterium]|nr:MAG: non-canonical purine NTP pyrophosphatase, RdgB/HAM1 family [Acidobacteriota bacterium]
MERTILIATFNRGKVNEINQFLSSLPIRGIDLHKLPGLAPCFERGGTFEENACQKARYYSQFSPALTLSDDSGLVVDALNGQPGVHSARFISEWATDEERNREVLFQMRAVPEERRSARFVCCMALARRGKLLDIFGGTVEGLIGQEPQGESGFGYDPIFFIPEVGKTMAELEPIEKLRVSHRGRALRKLGGALGTSCLVIKP